MKEIKVAAVSGLSTNKIHKFEFDDQVVAIINLDGDFYALDGMCGHAGGPLCNGEVFAKDKTVSCPWHGWEYSLETGECVFDSSLSQKTYATEVRDGDLYIKLS